MRLRILLPILLFALTSLNAQVTLFSENFNNCTLPPGWQVNSVGNQNPKWSVGISQNNSSLGQSIDGSCFLFIDDRGLGSNTQGYTLSFTSPPFNASQHTTVELTMDVHYRDLDGTNDYLEVLVTDGTTEKLVSRFDRFRKNGSNIADHFKLKADLALLTQSATARLIIRYSDGNAVAWWAGVDNIMVVGSGTGVNVVRESFNDCAKPAGWATQMVTGNKDWRFGLIPTGSNALQGGNSNSMNGTCFAFFDDDNNGGNAAPSIVRLMTPWIDGTPFSNFQLSYDWILRFYKEKMRVFVQHASGEEFLIRETNGDVGGPYFPNFAHESYDISPYRAQQMRIVFEYDDGKDWGWWGGVDNVKVTGSGVSHDLCSKAVQLTTGAPCTLENNISATFDGPLVNCWNRSVASLWYKWQADFTGSAKITTRAAFNDVVDVFSGGCASPQLIVCGNRDEHGFGGETTYFQAQSGTQYFIRVSGVESDFGAPRGELCVEITQGNAPNPPTNDNCADAIPLTANHNCTIASNSDATMSSALPSLNRLARADLWYTFTAEAIAADEILEIQSNASFSDIITLYTGGCNSLQELSSNHHGRSLRLPPLTVGQNYWVQIAGNFSTIEGSLCPQLIKKDADAPSNDNCLTANPVSLGSQCTVGNNQSATPSGYLPTCIQSVQRDIWFSFTAPPSGSVHLNSGADFEHSLAIWKGTCNNLSQVFCASNPRRCDGFVTAIGLEAGETYYVQIASRTNAAGDVCLKIVNGANPPDFQPLSLEVDENCVGLGTAELQVTVNGGVQPYSYSANTDGEVLPSGDTFLVIVTDANGCERSVTGIVDDCQSGNCALAATIEVVQPKCFGSADGILSASLVSGTAPYLFKWSNTATTSSIANLVAGNYSVTITDATGCTITLSQNLSAPAAVAITPTVTNPLCSGQTNGAIATVVTGGTQPYQYQWSNNATTANITNLASGTYLLTVTDVNGCSGTTTRTLTAPDPIAIAAFPQNPKCSGEANGSISINVDGGTAPFQYQWSNNATTANLNNLTAGPYTLTVTDANGCSATITRTLLAPPALQIAQGNIVQPTQGQSNGTIHVTVTGGTGAYSFIWYRNNTLFASGTEDLINVPAGDYRLEVTDANGCKAIFTYNLTGTTSTYQANDAFYAEVFPNPAHERAILAVAFAQPQQLELMLTDATGRTLHAWTVDKVTKQHIPLDLNNLPSGMYQLRILAGSDVVGKKIVVER
ncbi:MAG: T9SS type A sorting domain-containing protein [Saprospiraceae bacterium]|nr:T9SS type A sorting domain-containing protein [Saprospiraceae bacterium]